ncbi:MAG: hypothetical protein PHC61_02020 [Chitinivibrionales bacterium]|nr:hypothetical protein [Chitinivibrionales bacterium]
MNKAKLLKVVNPVVSVLFILQVLTILALLFLGGVLDADNFIAIHKGIGLTLVIFSGVHIYLNWSWIKTNMFPKRKG